MARRGTRIEYPFRPPGDARALACLLGIGETRLLRLADSVGLKDYRVVSVTPPPPRTQLPAKVVYDARTRLKELQKSINRRFFSQLHFPAHIVGGVPGRSLRSAVARHVHARSLMTFDVVRFFESTSEWQVQRALQHELCLKPEVARLLTSLTTVNGHVPRGAPTSTYLANLVLLGKESEFAAWLNAYEPQRFRYTRWVDDMTITSQQPLEDTAVKEVTARVSAMLRSHGLSFQRESGVPRQKRRKRRTVYDASVITVHNIEIRGDQLSPRKSLRRLVRASVHRLEKAVADRALEPNERDRLNSVTSMVGHLKDFYPEEMEVYRMRLRQIRRAHAITNPAEDTPSAS